MTWVYVPSEPPPRPLVFIIIDVVAFAAVTAGVAGAGLNLPFGVVG